MAGASAERVLIYRLGSLGDTVVALPAFHLIARRFADAERRVLTNVPVARAAPAPAEILGASGLVHGYFAYPIGTRRLAPLLQLRAEIAAWRPGVAVYLNEPRAGGLAATLRDALFLMSCGVRRVLGLPFAGARRRHAAAAHGVWESEAARLARALAGLGDCALHERTSWDLRLDDTERAQAAAVLADWPAGRRFVALAPGTKVAFKDWGEARWRETLATLAAFMRANLGLVLIGAEDDRARAERLAALWPGPARDLSGRLTPRVSAAVIARAAVFLGPDSGPMHLAAAVGTPIVAVFSTQARPGIWFPLGRRHRVFYPGLAWSGGEPLVFREASGETAIGDIRARDVAQAVLAQLEVAR